MMPTRRSMDSGRERGFVATVAVGRNRAGSVGSERGFVATVTLQRTGATDRGPSRRLAQSVARIARAHAPTKLHGAH